MEFSKYEATGNDFIMLDCFSGEFRLTADDVRSLCDRHRGVGADGVIAMLSSESADLKMRIFNADGSEAQMCGNGARALFRFARERVAVPGSRLVIETAAGPRTVTAVTGEDGSELFTVEMGTPSWRCSEIPMAGDGDAIRVPIDVGDGVERRATCVSMGNPHCVLFVPDVHRFQVSEVGPRVEAYGLFPERANVEFVTVQEDSRLSVRVWERGVGETMACGTGACAAVVAANLEGRCGREAVVALPGGDLKVEWSDPGVTLTGPARHVFDGRTVN